MLRRVAGHSCLQSQKLCSVEMMLQLHMGQCAFCKNVRMQMEKRACFLPGDPRPPPTHMHSQSAGSPLLRWVGAEESSLKDGEIFNDLSELTRFEAKGEKERGKDPKTSERGVFSKILSAPRLCVISC